MDSHHRDDDIAQGRRQKYEVASFQVATDLEENPEEVHMNRWDMKKGWQTQAAEA